MSPRSPVRSDGEVSSGDEEKAITTHNAPAKNGQVNTSTRLPQTNGSSSRASRSGSSGLSQDPYYHFRDENGNVNLPSRTSRERSRSPYRRERERSRSPYRAGKPASRSGEKRAREEDHYGKNGSDSRRHKVHYEDRPGSRGDVGYRSQRSYADLDYSDASKGQLQYEERSGRLKARSGRDRSRSRSPYRHTKADPSKATDSRDKAHRRSNTDALRRSSTSSVTERESAPQTTSKDDTKIKVSLPHQQTKQATVDDVPDRSVLPFVNLCPMTDNVSHRTEPAEDAQPRLSEAELIEQRRKRREAIKNRHKAQPPLLVQALEQNMQSTPATPAHESSDQQTSQTTAESPPSSVDSPRTPGDAPSTPNHDSPPESPAEFAVMNDEELANRHQGDVAMHEEEGPSAADYDPNMDMQEDRPDHKRTDVEAPMPEAVEPSLHQPESEAATKKSKEYDMFAEDDDEDDMFAPDDARAKPTAASKQGKTLDQSLLDNWDYPDGHYRIILGELLDNRYAIQQQVGKGTFATVVKAQDTKTGHAVAIKIAANNETMYKAGQKEMDFLQILNDNDADDKKHIIRLLTNFEHKGHMCIVFEALSADLREVLKKFGRNVGLNLKAIRSYAQQMFLALSHMKKCNILHADLKPDNILVSEKRSLLKICDLGTASFAHDAEVTPYLVSRFYRAPEVILGMPFGYEIDMWSIGCTLFELYTGRILFAGADNNQMLRTIQECRGKVPIRMLKKSSLAERHFDFDGNFFSQERDKITGKTLMKPMNFNSKEVSAGKDLRSRLAGNAKGLSPAELREHASFVDLLDKCLQLDPARRVSPNDALRHGFVAHGGAGGGGEKSEHSRKLKPAMPAAPAAIRMR